MLPFRIFIVTFALLSGILTSFSIFAYEAVYDRLDGTGHTKKRVDVIEWEGNLEIHVYPKGSTQGIGAKLDDREAGKKVMVIGYHFHGHEQIVRRAILGVPFTSNVMGFIDPTEREFDKIALSNKQMPKPWIPYKLMPAPRQWGPDGSKYDEDVEPEFLGEMRKNTIPSTLRRSTDPVTTEDATRAPASADPVARGNEGDLNHVYRRPIAEPPRKPLPGERIINRVDRSGVKIHEW